jgi:modulator of FtsH protease
LFAYDPSEWTDLFVATAGASAALAGLVFVAVSINLERILSFRGLPERALETLLFLVSVLLISVVALIPGQDHVALGVELLVISLAIDAIVMRQPTIQVEEGEAMRRSWRVSRWTLRLIATVPFLIGAVSLIAASGGGLYWLVAGIVLAVAAGVSNAWVLLVEILR